jgi:hypothetical protein
VCCCKICVLSGKRCPWGCRRPWLRRYLLPWLALISTYLNGEFVSQVTWDFISGDLGFYRFDDNIACCLQLLLTLMVPLFRFLGVVMQEGTSSCGWTIELSIRLIELMLAIPRCCSTAVGVSPQKCRPQRYRFLFHEMWFTRCIALTPDSPMHHLLKIIIMLLEMSTVVSIAW